MVSAAGGSLQVISSVFSSLKMYSSHLIPPVIDQDDTFYDPSHMRVQQQMSTSLSLSKDECHSFEMPQVLTSQALKGNGRGHLVEFI